MGRTFRDANRQSLLRARAIADTCEAVPMLANASGEQKALFVVRSARVVVHGLRRLAQDST
nr:hypothetical protein [Nitrosovibrio sp. Nv17]